MIDKSNKRTNIQALNDVAQFFDDMISTFIVVFSNDGLLTPKSVYSVYKILLQRKQSMS